MKSQKSAVKTVKTKPASAETQLVPATGFSLEPVYTALRKRYPAAGQAEAVAFAADFYKRMEADEFPHHSVEEWAALAADTLEFARVRKGGKANVRVFNPTLKANGWESPHTVLQIVNDDMPFLVDTVTMALAEQGIGVHVLGHPVIRFGRDKAGRLTSVGEGTIESVMLLEIDRQTPEAMETVEQVIVKALEEVRSIVRDWQPMRRHCPPIATAVRGRTVRAVAASDVNRTQPVSAYSVLQQGLFLQHGYNFIFPTGQHDSLCHEIAKVCSQNRENQARPGGNPACPGNWFLAGTGVHGLAQAIPRGRAGRGSSVRRRLLQAHGSGRVPAPQRGRMGRAGR